MFFADLHIHSKYSRATGKDADLEHMALWARKKGVTVVGTGDFTHPQWMKELREKLVPAEPGLFRLRDDLEREVQRQLNESGFEHAPAIATQADAATITRQATQPDLLQGATRFLLEVEISTIYKKGDRTRKVHHCVYAPDFEAADRIVAKLARIGNLASDGRPILGLDSRNLLEIVLDSSPHSYLIPAHIWTPWFAVLGSKSGFDTIDDCYGDLTQHIFALETGLSSDPQMNWRLSQLDRYTLVSNSDAHSPPKIGREASGFQCDLSYFAMKQALETRCGYAGTVEFFPEEGKYHLDGHRTCGIRLLPPESKQLHNICPTCGKELTIGVMHRVDDLADRAADFLPQELQPSARNLIPLPEVISEIKGLGESSKAVVAAYDQALAKVGSELFILDQAPVEELKRLGSPLLAEAIGRMRSGRVIRDAGYDGEYGVIRVFQPGELANRGMKSLLFEEPAEPVTKTTRASSEVSGACTPSHTQVQPFVENEATTAAADRPKDVGSVTDQHGLNAQSPAGPLPPKLVDSSPQSVPIDLRSLDADQRLAAQHTQGPLLIIAGPGTGKTRTLTQRIVHVVREHGVAPEQCLTITFSRRAASELAERLQAAVLKPNSPSFPVMTFHALGLLILQEHSERCGLTSSFRIATDDERSAALQAATELSIKQTTQLLRNISHDKRTFGLADLEGVAIACNDSVRRCDSKEIRLYRKLMCKHSWVDFDDLILLPTKLLTEHPEIAAIYRARWPFVSVDEFQDIDARQYDLVRLLTSSTSNICVIGDPDQSIYGFRGADPQIFKQFLSDYPTAASVPLRKNYRSTSTIVSAALQAIRPSSLVTNRELQAVAAQTEFIDVQTCPTVAAEAEFVVHTVERLLGGSTMFSFDSGRVAHGEGEAWSFRDFAVLSRTDTQANAIAEALDRSGIPYQHRSHRVLAEHPAIQALQQQLTPSPKDAASVADLPLLERVKQAADAIWSDHPEIATVLPSLHAVAENCADDVSRFVEQLALLTDVDLHDPRADRVSLLTLHASKGLEFGVVFLIGCDELNLPLRFSLQPLSERETAEERRLFFVGLTRARRRLFLTYAEQRLWNGHVCQTGPSPFLKPIQNELLRREKLEHRRPKQTPRKQLALFE